MLKTVCGWDKEQPGIKGDEAEACKRGLGDHGELGPSYGGRPSTVEMLGSDLLQLWVGMENLFKGAGSMGSNLLAWPSWASVTLLSMERS